MRQSGRTLSLRGSLTLCALSGVMLSLCFPPVGWWPLAWVALVPWLVSVRMSSRLGTALGSWLGGFAFFGALLYWLYLFGVSVLVMVAALLGLVMMVWGLLARWVGRLAWAPRMIGTAAVWCGVEWARGLGQYGFTWGWLAYSQSPALPVLSVARLAGALGLSFVIVLCNAAVAEAVAETLRRSSPELAVARGLVGVAAAAACVGGARWLAQGHPVGAGPRLRVAVVQGSTHDTLRAAQVNQPLSDAEQRRDVATYLSLTAQAAQQDPALVVWPESALPGAPGQSPWIASAVSGAVRASGAWLLAGGPYVDERGRPANSAYLYSPTGNLVARYDKVQLVPFGEYVPGREWLPFLDRYHIRDQDFVAGAEHHPLQAGTTGIGPMICFESIFPTIAWHLAREGAQVLVVMTNDAWFGRTAAAAQHQQIAALRAVETGRWVVRAASTGISSIISPDGRVVARTGLFERTVIAADVRLVSPPGAGARWGPVVAWGLMGLAIAFVIAPAAAPRALRGPRGPERAPRRQGTSREAQPKSRPPKRGRAGAR